MSAPIAYDVFRLLLGSLAVTPRGIDRVDFRYARFFFETWPGDCFGTLPTPWGVRRYDRRRVLQGLDRLEQLWSETVQSHEDRVLSRIKRRLSGKHDLPTERSRGEDRQVVSPASRFVNLLSVAGFSFGASVIRAAPKNAIYVNVGQVGLAIPWIVSWLRHRPDVKSVFMLHDVIPLERPELVSSKDQRRHLRIVDRTARYASGLIASTAAAREAVLNALCLRGRATIPVETVPFPVAPVFLENDGPDQELGECDYFVVCGTIEPRKNHRLLLNVWRELVGQRGQHAPRLVIVGSPGWGAGPVLDALERCRPLHDQVILARGLSSPALRRLIAHAKALLMPSFAEGFGLPIIEALAVGTPVIASDLPAHREIAGNLAVYRDPTAVAGWLADICMFADGGGAAAEIRRRVAQYRPTTWGEYFIRIERFLKTFEQP
jgi:glycosyltransferase involved in cell wall biosynthesis